MLELRNIQSKRRCSLKFAEFFAGNRDLTVIRAEFIIEHYLPLACADHARPLSFSEAISGCGHRQKIWLWTDEDILHSRPWQKFNAKLLIGLMKKSAFSIATDGSNELPSCIQSLSVSSTRISGRFYHHFFLLRNVKRHQRVKICWIFWMLSGRVRASHAAKKIIPTFHFQMLAAMV